MTALIVTGVVAVVAIVVVTVAHMQHASATDEANQAVLDLMQSEFHAEAMAREDMHDRHLGTILSLVADQARDLRAEREQHARLDVSKNPGDYALLERTARIPDEALGEAEVHRAEMLAGRGARRPDAPVQDSPLVDSEGRPIVPAGAGG